jgi:hypothetical protein
MTTYTPQAQKLRDDYLRSVRDCFSGSKTVDGEEVVRDISEHIEQELQDAQQPVSQADMAKVIDHLGDPRQWGSESEQATSSAASSPATEEQFSKRFIASPGGTLVVDANFGSIAVSANTTNEVVVDVWRKIGGKGAAHEHGFKHKFHFPFHFAFPKDCGMASGDFGSVKFSGGKIKVNTGKGREIEVDVPLPGDVTVDVNVGGEGGEKLGADEQEFLRKYPVSIRQEGNTVTVEATGGDCSGRKEAKYTISVPAQFNAKLQTSGGSISVSDLAGEVKAQTSGGQLKFTRVRGALKGETSGGSIYVNDCEGAIKVETSGSGIEVIGGSGALKGETSGGPVKVKDFQGSVNIETSGSGITIENITGAINAETSGGSVSAVLSVPLAGPVNLETSGGGITLRVPEHAAFELNAETSGGGVKCELPVTTVGSMGRDHLKGAVNGGGTPVHLETSGGSIHIKKL